MVLPVLVLQLAGTSAVPTEPPASITNSSLRGRHILVVEDEALIAMLLQDVLEDAGCTVTVVHDGYAALDAAGPGAARFDALVLNLGLPNLNGTEVIARLRAARPLLPVLVVTGFVQSKQDGLPRSLLWGRPIAVLAKPFDPDAVTQAVADLIAEAE